MAALLLNACSQVQIKDEQVCADMGSQGATCDNFLSSAPVDFNKSDWDDKRFGEFCMTSDAFADFKQEIEDLCSASGDCNYPAIQAAVARVQALHARLRGDR